MIYFLLYIIIGIMVALVFRTQGDVDGVLFLHVALLWPYVLISFAFHFVKDMLK